MKYSFVSVFTPEEKAQHAADIEAYYQVRAGKYASRLNDEHYKKYPQEHDLRNDTGFVILKFHNEQTGEDEVIGGQRVVFYTKGRQEKLPVSGHHKTLTPELEYAKKLPKEDLDKRLGRLKRFPALKGKEALESEDIVPALRTDSELVVAELGGFCIDSPVLAKDKYEEMREATYAACLAGAKAHGANISLMAATTSNRENHVKWLKRTKAYPFKVLEQTADLFTNPVPPPAKGEKDESTTILLINLTPKNYSLEGAESILRYGQEDREDTYGNMRRGAQSHRNDKPKSR